MRTSKIALIVYFFCCIVAIIADIFKSDALMLFAIPLILPSLFFYYYGEINSINILVCLFLASNFIGDSIGLMDFEDELYYIIPPFFISNLLVVIILLKRLEKFKFNFFNVFSLTMIAVFLIYILSMFLELFSVEDVNLEVYVAVFGVLLIILTLLASYNVIWRINTSNLFLMMFACSVLISDVFYLVFNFQNQLVVLDSIHFSCQMVSYFFFIKYILLREKRNLISV